MKVCVYDKYEGSLYTGLTLDLLAQINEDMPTREDMETLLSKSDRFETMRLCVIRDE